MWVIKRKKSHVFELEFIPEHTKLVESYTLMYISDEQKQKFCTYPGWQQGFGVWQCQSKQGEPVYELFMTIAKEKFEHTKTYNFAKKTVCDVIGTSRLVRDSAKTHIYIARRKGVQTLNETRINSVCIDNHTRDYFFADVRRKHEGMPFFGHYEFFSGDEYFDKWSKIMDKLYLEQTRQI